MRWSASWWWTVWCTAGLQTGRPSAGWLSLGTAPGSTRATRARSSPWSSMLASVSCDLKPACCMLSYTVYNSILFMPLSIVWTACGDSIARAFDAKSGALKRSFVGHEAAVNCMVGWTNPSSIHFAAQMITEGKLYTGSSDGTLRVWNAKDVSEELLWGSSLSSSIVSPMVTYRHHHHQIS